MCLAKESDLDTETKRDHVMKKIEIGVIQILIKKWQEFWEPAETRREANMDCCL